MIHPFISYCNTAWASTLQTKLQPIFTKTSTEGHCPFTAKNSLPLVRKFGILIIYQINSLQIIQSVYGSLNKTLPPFSLSTSFH